MNVVDEQSRPNPTPFRPTAGQAQKLKELSKLTGLPMSHIIRRCVAFALPKMESGEVPIVDVTPKHELAGAGGGR